MRIQQANANLQQVIEELELWRLSPLFCCLQGTKTLNNLKNTFISIIFE